MVSLLLRKARAVEVVDVGSVLAKLANNVISSMVMRKRCSEKEDDVEEVRNMIKDISYVLGAFNVSDYIWFCKNLDLQGIKKRLVDVRGRYDRLIERIIEEHMQIRRKRQEKDDGSHPQKDFIDLLLDMSEEDSAEFRLNMDQIKAIVLKPVRRGYVGQTLRSDILMLQQKEFFMVYIHASPMLESSSAFESLEAAEKTAAALGLILLLDLVISNEDRLPCQELRWRGNSANLLLADKMASANIDGMEEAFGTVFDRYRPRVSHPIQKERRSTSVDSSVSPHSPGLVSQSSELSDVIESPKSSNMSLKSQSSIDS